MLDDRHIQRLTRVKCKVSWGGADIARRDRKEQKEGKKELWKAKRDDWSDFYSECSQKPFSSPQRKNMISKAEKKKKSHELCLTSAPTRIIFCSSKQSDFCHTSEGRSKKYSSIWRGTQTLSSFILKSDDRKPIEPTSASNQLYVLFPSRISLRTDWVFPKKNPQGKFELLVEQTRVADFKRILT